MKATTAFAVALIIGVASGKIGHEIYLWLGANKAPLWQGIASLVAGIAITMTFLYTGWWLCDKLGTQ